MTTDGGHGARLLDGRAIARTMLAEAQDDLATVAAAAGAPLSRDVESFWRRYLFWYRWLPFLTSGAALWAGVTALAVVAGVRRRRRDAAIRRQWELEERVTEDLDAGSETVN